MNNIVGVGREFNHSVIDVATDSTTVSAKPSLLRLVYVNTTLSAQALPIKDGTTTVFTIPASATAGTLYDFGDTVFNNGIVVDPDNAATGNITVTFKQMVP